jgi:hypothetical protein
MPAEGLEGMAELVDRTAIELAHGHELVARLHDGMEHEELRCMAGGDGKCGRATFEGRNLCFQYRLRRVHDACIDVAEGAEREEIGGVLHILEDEGGGLVDRRDAGARCRVRCRARVKRQRVEARGLVCHCRLPFVVRGGTLARAAQNDNCRDVSAGGCA